MRTFRGHLYNPKTSDAIDLTRPRSTKDRIKDWFFVDEIREYWKNHKG
ncbi:MAG: hypothetical protein IJV33_02735 [Bacteroidaceae bacterium]|nr:hypothetical protein [Bacteroidaceae bacterium]